MKDIKCYKECYKECYKWDTTEFYHDVNSIKFDSFKLFLII